MKKIDSNKQKAILLVNKTADRMEERLTEKKNLQKTQWRELNMADNLYGVQSAFNDAMAEYNKTFAAMFPTGSPESTIKKLVDLINRSAMLIDQIDQECIRHKS